MMYLLRDSFYRRIALTLLVGFVVMAALFVFLLRSVSQTSQLEITQRLHQSLAQHIVDENTFFIDGQSENETAKGVFMHMMVLGPAFEFYLLDKTGRILAYSAKPDSIKRDRVDLQPLLQFIQGDASLALPLEGEDPRSVDGCKIFSAAPIMQQNTLQGYLYVIIGGEIADTVAASVKHNQTIVTAIGTIVAGCLFGLLATLAVIALLTRPLRQLSRDVVTFQKQGLDNGRLHLHQWDQSAKNDIHRLGCAFAALSESLREQYTKVKSVDDLRKDLLAHVSHDLRTPLASLRGFLETWLLKYNELSPEESLHYIEVAHNNAKKINVLVDQLFELAYLDGDNVQVACEPIAIAELVQDVLQKFQLDAEEKGVKLDIRPKDPAIMVEADIEKLERVFSNLIENAIRHCDSGDTICVGLSLDQGRVTVKVEDSGRGIPPMDLPHIFDAHYKAANSVRDNSAHGGLGLAIVKRLLDLHNASIRVVSQERAGTTFLFDLAAV